VRRFICIKLPKVVREGNRKLEAVDEESDEDLIPSRRSQVKEHVIER
jgi:hypothetical protein